MTPKELMNQFEHIRYMAELKALSNLSLQRLLDEQEYKRMFELKKILFGNDDN